MVITPLGSRIVGISIARRWQWTLCKGLKDKVEPERKNGVVDQISCKDCTGSHVDETLILMKTGVDEYKLANRSYEFFCQALKKKQHKIDWPIANLWIKKGNEW